MSFDDLPAVDHVVYDDQRLERVICQLKFMPLLKIAADVPADFQEALGDEYPRASTEQAAGFSIAIQGERIAAQTPTSLARTWEFSTRDENWKVTLAQESLALQVSDYPDFEEFAERLGHIISVASDTYRIPMLTRIGLRYSNSFGPELGPPAEIVSEPLLGLYSSVLASTIQESRVEYTLGEEPHRIGLRMATVARPGGEDRFLLDFDHYTEVEIAPEDAMGVVRAFHGVNYRLFRWATTDKLHERMRPRDG